MPRFEYGEGARDFGQVLIERAADAFIELTISTWNLKGKDRDLIEAYRPKIIRFFELAIAEVDNPETEFPTNWEDVQ